MEEHKSVANFLRGLLRSIWSLEQWLWIHRYDDCVAMPSPTLPTTQAFILSSVYRLFLQEDGVQVFVQFSPSWRFAETWVWDRARSAKRNKCICCGLPGILAHLQWGVRSCHKFLNSRYLSSAASFTTLEAVCLCSTSNASLMCFSFRFQDSSYF